TLATEQGALITALRAAERTYLLQERELARLEEDGAFSAPTLAELAEWEAIITDAQATQPLLLALSEDEAELGNLRLEAEKIRASLGVSLPWRELSALLPSRETVERGLRHHSELQRTRLRLIESLRRHEATQRDLAEQISAEEAAGLPSEEQ